jgi:uncharacterized protein (TIGR01244 family)
MSTTTCPTALVVVACLAPALAAAGPPESVDPGRIPAYRLVRPDLATAGQPSPEALTELKAMGFKTVVNLRTVSEGPADERALVESQGLRYVQVPITPDSFSLADAEAVEKALDDPAAGPVLLHCASSNRVGGVWAVLQARQGKPFEEAEAAGRAAGLKSASMVAAVRRVLGLPPDPAAAVPAPVKP